MYFVAHTRRDVSNAWWVSSWWCFGWVNLVDLGKNWPLFTLSRGNGDAYQLRSESKTVRFMADSLMREVVIDHLIGSQIVSNPALTGRI